MFVRRYLRPLMRVRRMPTAFRCLGALALVFVAFGIRYATVGESLISPYLGFLPAVIVAAVIFDRGAGFLATAVSGPLAFYFFVEPRHTFRFQQPADLINFGLLSQRIILRVGN